MAEAKQNKWDCSLQVMRLTKPSLMPHHAILADSKDLPYDALNQILSQDLSGVQDAPYLGSGELLTLPQNFGNIFLGETFSSYISVHNDSNQICKDVQVKADLQTSLQRISLCTNNDTIPDLCPNSSIDEVIHHEVKELGTHILVCAVSYTTLAGEKMYFRKFFKFQVLKPLDLKPRFFNSESEDVFLEAQIQNLTPNPIFLERVTMDSAAEYTATEMNSQPEGPDGKCESIFGKVNVLNPMDRRQYLYCLTPKPELYGESKLIKGIFDIGKLDIVWKTTMAEKGRLQTSPLQRVAPGYGDIRLIIEYMPDAVALEKPFSVTYKVTNCSERNMDLTLSLENNPNSGLLWCGISGRALGQLQPGESKNLNLTLIGISPGLRTISGLKLVDTFLKRTYEHDEIAQIFIFSSAATQG